jgi:hypothetical protein
MLRTLLRGLGVTMLLAASWQARATTDWDARLRVEFQAIHGTGTVTALSAVTKRAPRRDMTTLLIAARKHWNELSPETQVLVRPWQSRPTDSTQSFEADWRYHNPETLLPDTAHFRVHYINRADFPTDPNAATTAFAQTVAQVLEETWTTEHTTLGYAAVPSDGTRGGSGLFDVYLTNLGAFGLYGYVSSEGASSDTTRPYGAYSYMVLDNDYSPAEYGYELASLPLKVTVAHEYFHAIQNGYSWEEDAAFMEQTATWMEDLVYPDIHDNYNYLGEPYVDGNGNGQFDAGEAFTDRNGDGRRDEGSVEYPEAPLDAFDLPPLVQYGRFVWIRYLYEKFDLGAPTANGLVKAVWTRLGQVAGDNTYAGLNEVLVGRGSSLASAYQEYATWGYDKSKFSDGTNYPLVWVDRTITGAAAVNSIDSPSLAMWNEAGYVPQLHLSTVYTQIKNPTGSYDFVSVGGAAAVTLLVDSGSGVLVHQNLTLANGTGTWSAPASTVKAIVVVSNVASGADGMDWVIRPSGMESSVAPTLSEISMVSNGSAISWESGVANVTVKAGTPFSFVASATDGDGTTPKFKIIGNDSAGKFDPITSTFNWAKDVTVGNYTVTLVAYDAVDVRQTTTGAVNISVTSAKKKSSGGGGFGALNGADGVMLLLTAFLLRQRRRRVEPV